MFDINTISGEPASEYKDYPGVLNYKLSNEFFVDAAANTTATTAATTSATTSTTETTETPIPSTIDKKGSGFFMNSVSIAMAFIIPLLFVIGLLVFKIDMFVFGGYNIVAVILGIFNLSIFIIALMNIDAMKNTYNCNIINPSITSTPSATPSTTLSTDIPSLTLSELNLGTEIETKLNLHPSATLCSSSLNNNTYNNLSGSGGYYGYIAFGIALQILQIILIGYTGMGLPIIYYIFIAFTLVGLFLALAVDIIANRMAYKCPDNVKTISQVITENKKNTAENVLTVDETKTITDNLAAAHIDDTYLICNSRTEGNINFSGKNINPTYSGFLIVTIMLTLFTFIFMTIFVFLVDNIDGSKLITLLQWGCMSITAGIIIGMLSFISALDQSYKYPERVALGTGIGSAVIPVIVKIVLAIISRNQTTLVVQPTI
jgi:hypothetical protein